MVKSVFCATCFENANVNEPMVWRGDHYHCLRCGRVVEGDDCSGDWRR